MYLKPKELKKPLGKELMQLNFPTTNITTEAENIISHALPSYILNHSKRTFLLATSYARKTDIKDYDEEGLYIATLFHDLGIVEINTKYAFQLNSSKKLKEFLLEKNYPQNKINVLVDAIDFHMQILPKWAKGKEVGLLQIGAWMDAFRLRGSKFKTEISDFEQLFPRLEMDSLMVKTILHTIKTIPAGLGLLFPEKYRE